MLTDVHHGNTALADKVQIVTHNIKKKKKKGLGYWLSIILWEVSASQPKLLK